MSKYQYRDTNGENFIIEDTETNTYECFTSGTVDCLQKVRREDITVFTKEQVEDIFNSDSVLVETTLNISTPND